jgi:hypothetical protein
MALNFRALRPSGMITGYNTDVRHHDVVFHVQTEDKGTSNPFIESLVYVGGRVVAAKRASYARLLAEGKGEKAIVALMEHQHRSLIGAIRGGKFDSKLAALIEDEDVTVEEVGVAGREFATLAEEEAVDEEPFADPNRTLDQVILDYLTSEAEQEQLVLTLNGLKSLAHGTSATLEVRTTSSKSGLPVASAEVMVKLISTISEPMTLAAGDTDDKGFLALNLAVPEASQGTAALVITAASAVGRAEVKHLL